MCLGPYAAANGTSGRRFADATALDDIAEVEHPRRQCARPAGKSRAVVGEAASSLQRRGENHPYRERFLERRQGRSRGQPNGQQESGGGRRSPLASWRGCGSWRTTARRADRAEAKRSPAARRQRSAADLVGVPRRLLELEVGGAAGTRAGKPRCHRAMTPGGCSGSRRRRRATAVVALPSGRGVVIGVGGGGGGTQAVALAGHRRGRPRRAEPAAAAAQGAIAGDGRPDDVAERQRVAGAAPEHVGFDDLPEMQGGKRFTVQREADGVEAHENGRACTPVPGKRGPAPEAALRRRRRDAAGRRDALRAGGDRLRVLR